VLKRWWAVVAALVVATVLLAAVVTVQAVMLYAQGWRVAWGSMPDWLAAIGGIATVGALLVAWLLYRHEVDTRVRDESLRGVVERRRQAELLTAWFVHYGSAKVGSRIVDGSPVGSAPTDVPPPVVNHAQVGLINASQVVVFDLIVAAICESSPPLPIAYSPTDIRISDPVEWDQERDRLARGRAPVLPPGQWSVGIRLATTSLRPIHLHLFFRDHRGVYWWRDAVGALTELPPPDDQDPRSRDRQIAEALGEPTDGRVRALIVKPLEDARAT
jgi:hypothetical protein